MLWFKFSPTTACGVSRVVDYVECILSPGVHPSFMRINYQFRPLDF